MIRRYLWGGIGILIKLDVSKMPIVAALSLRKRKDATTSKIDTRFSFGAQHCSMISISLDSMKLRDLYRGSTNGRLPSPAIWAYPKTKRTKDEKS
jgi:hypothetical protein